jgi:HD-like signal output (HDOD) protein
MSVDALLDRLRADLEAGTLLLPTLPEIAIRVQEVVADPDAEVADVAAVLRADASLSARLLALANSPFLRARDPIADIKAAVNRLGLDYIQYLVAGFATEQLFNSRHAGLNEFLKDLWTHSFKVASLSQVLAIQHTKLRGEQAFIAGLLHDVGALPIIRYAEDDAVNTVSGDLLAWVDEQHPRVGGLLLEHWGFPPELVEVSRWHEDPTRDGGPRPDLVDVVQVANIQSRLGSDHPLTEVNISEVPAYRKLGLAMEIDPAMLAFAASLQNNG